jgi:hypothetical protein
MKRTTAIVGGSMRILLALLILTSGLACEKTIKEAKAPRTTLPVVNVVR